ncbi:MAG: hypothetical protein M5U34_41645 [Chloroflexi bacterium]|nr:hypothetical protein [Chloroflexota bacterium]
MKKAPRRPPETDPLADLENMQEELDQAFNQADAAKPGAGGRPAPPRSCTPGHCRSLCPTRPG